MKLVGALFLLIVIFDLIIVCGMGEPQKNKSLTFHLSFNFPIDTNNVIPTLFILGNMGTFTTIMMFVFLFAIIGVLLAISRKSQNR